MEQDEGIWAVFLSVAKKKKMFYWVSMQKKKKTLKTYSKFLHDFTEVDRICDTAGCFIDCTPDR